MFQFKRYGSSQMIISQYNKKILSGFAILLISVLCSCSRQTSSIAHIKKLSNKQFLTALNVNSNPQPVNIENTSPLPIMPPPALQNPQKNYLQATRIKKPLALVFHISSKQFTNSIQNQVLAPKKVLSPRHTTSYSGTSKTQGLLGLAILCLIAGLVLAFFGFLEIAALLWIFGIICLAAAILFFVLWLIFGGNND